MLPVYELEEFAKNWKEYYAKWEGKIVGIYLYFNFHTDFINTIENTKNFEIFDKMTGDDSLNIVITDNIELHTKYNSRKKYIFSKKYNYSIQKISDFAKDNNILSEMPCVLFYKLSFKEIMNNFQNPILFSFRGNNNEEIIKEFQMIFNCIKSNNLDNLKKLRNLKRTKIFKKVGDYLLSKLIYSQIEYFYNRFNK